MGQQQLLLITLVTIIIGIATIIAILLFKSETVILLEDEFTESMLETANDLQVYYHKPSILGGGNHSFKGANFKQIPCRLGKVGPGEKPASCSDDTNQYKLNIFSARADSVALYCDIKVNSEQYEAEYVVYPDKIRLKKKWTKL